MELISAEGKCYEEWINLQQSLAKFSDCIQDTIQFPATAWTDGKEVTITLDFKLVPVINCKISKS